MPSFVDKIVDWYRGKTRTYLDLLAVALAVIPLYSLLVKFDVFDKINDWTQQYEAYEIDELFSLGFCLGIAAAIFGWRRLNDLRKENTTRRRAEEEAERLSRHDLLTGLPNRRQFLEEFQRCGARLTPGTACALFLIDLDHFKPINDLYGHRLGDEVLRVIARRLTEIVGDQGLVARLGGDEFAVLMHFREHDDTPMRLARRIVYEVPRPIPLAALVVDVGASVGVATYSAAAATHALAVRDGSAVETVMRQADMAMYRAKTEGRGRYRFFDPDMDEMLQRRIQLERDIKGAIADHQIVPFYQPLVDLRTQSIIGYEILARWNHPTRGLVLPEIFIPIAEDTGAIGEMTYNLLARALQDAKHWPQELFISLNLSPRQFADPLLTQRLLAVLREAHFPPHRLEIEITETAVVQRLEEAKATLKLLRSHGVRVALDDFGTGYSGLYHLRELELDTIKIDRSFVTHMIEKPEEAKIVEAIVGLGHALGLQTTAEGIETEDVLKRLGDLGCEMGQGFLFGRPEPISSELLKEQLRRHRRSA